MMVTSPKNANPAKRYYHTDHLFSVYALTDAAGAVVERYRYEAYGKATVLNASFNPKSDPNYSAYANPWTFTGQRLDAETSLHYYKNRYYSSGLGRFVGRDPLGLLTGPNPYEYCGGGPVNCSDPLGLYWLKSATEGGWIWIPEEGKPDPTEADLRELAQGTLGVNSNFGAGYASLYARDPKDGLLTATDKKVYFLSKGESVAAAQEAGKALAQAYVDQVCSDNLAKVNQGRAGTRYTARVMVNGQVAGEVTFASEADATAWMQTKEKDWQRFAWNMKFKERFAKQLGGMKEAANSPISFLMTMGSPSTLVLMATNEAMGGNASADSLKAASESKAASGFDILTGVLAASSSSLAKNAETTITRDAVAGGDEALNAATRRSSKYLNTLPSSKTANYLERFAQKKGLKYKFDPNITSPFTNKATGEITFRGTPGVSTLADVPIIDIMDEFGHAYGKKIGLEASQALRGPVYDRFHKELFGRTSMLKTLTEAEAEALQWAEIYMKNKIGQ